jgi:hypothetical protein
MWIAYNPNMPEIAFQTCVFNTSTKKQRPYAPSDCFVAKFKLDINAWAEQPRLSVPGGPPGMVEQFIKSCEGFFADEVGRDRVLGRLAVALLACKGNIRKVALVFQGEGNNGKSALLALIKCIFELESLGGKKYHWVTESTAEVRFYYYFGFTLLLPLLTPPPVHRLSLAPALVRSA